MILQKLESSGNSLISKIKHLWKNAFCVLSYLSRKYVLTLRIYLKVFLKLVYYLVSRFMKGRVLQSCLTLCDPMDYTFQ